jgi:hypothetical protein
LRRDRVRIAESRHHPPLGLGSARWIGGSGLPQVVFDLGARALRECAVEAQPTGQRVDVLGNYAGFLDDRPPPRSPPIASVNSVHTARCSARARLPRFVRE